MKKLTTLSLAILIGLSVTACNDKEESKTAEQASQVVADPATEYKTLVDWELAQDQKMQAISAELQQKAQQALQTQQAGDLDKAIQEYLTKLDEVVKEFDALKFQSPEIQNLAAHKKTLYTTSAEALTFVMKMMAHPETATKADEEKLAGLTQTLQQTTAEIEKIQTELNQKYPQALPAVAPATPAQPEQK